MNKELEEAIQYLENYINDIKKVDTCEIRTRVIVLTTILNYIENSIPTSVVEEKIEYIEDYFERLNGPDEDIEYIRKIKQELLQEKGEK